MSREVCVHGVEITGGYKRLCCELCEADVVGEGMAAAQKYRRAEWIRNNVALLWIGGSLEHTQKAIDGAEKMADELIKRGYL